MRRVKGERERERRIKGNKRFYIGTLGTIVNGGRRYIVQRRLCSGPRDDDDICGQEDDLL